MSTNDANVDRGCRTARIGRRRSSFTAAKTLLTAAAALGAAGFAAADVWFGPTHYLHKREGMPDLDQQRDGGPGCFLQPSPAIPVAGGCGFIFPGGMHCGPTSTTNLRIFMANHGYPAFLPAGQHGDIWRQPAWFCPGTDMIAAMGTASGWTLGGTSTLGLATGLQKAVKAAGQPIAVGHYLATGTYGVHLNHLAYLAYHGAIATVLYGHYQVTGFSTGGIPVVRRNGGHFVTMTGLYRNGPIMKLRVRDPADDGCAPVLPTQAAYKDHVYNGASGWVRVIQPPFAPQYRWMTRIYPEAAAPGFGVGSTISLLDGVTYCAPRRGIGKPFTAADGPQEFVTFGPAEPWSTDGAVECAPLDLGAPIIDATLHPEGIGVIAIIEGGGVGAGTRSVVAVDETSQDATTLAEIAGASALLVGRNRAVYVTEGTTLHRLDLPDGAEDARPEEGDEDADRPAGTTTLPFELDAFDYDDFGDRVVGLSIADSSVATVDKDFTSAVESMALPEGVTPAEGATIAVNPADGIIWMASTASNSVYGISESKGALTVVDEIVVPVAVDTAIADIEFVGADDLIVVTQDGEQFAFQRSEERDADWTQVDPALELPCGLSAIRPMRSRGNFNHGEHDDPDAFFDLNPGDVIPGVEEPDPLCTGDLDADGIVGPNDLSILLGAWGESFGTVSDMNADGLVDGKDLALVLGHWGPCPG